jgi:hypothetical protein
MKRGVEVAGGIGVFLLCLQYSVSLFQRIFTYQRSARTVSVVSLSIEGAILLLSYVGAFILLSWAKKPK